MIDSTDRSIDRFDISHLSCWPGSRLRSTLLRLNHRWWLVGKVRTVDIFLDGCLLDTQLMSEPEAQVTGIILCENVLICASSDCFFYLHSEFF